MTMPEQDPTPRGTPNRAFFIVGGIGSIVNIVAAILLFFFDSLIATTIAAARA